MSKRDSDLKKFEKQAEEVVALTVALCEERLALASAPLTPRQIALSAAAMAFCQAVETFLAVAKMRFNTKE